MATDGGFGIKQAKTPAVPVSDIFLLNEMGSNMSVPKVPSIKNRAGKYELVKSWGG
jgi:hypothetical protein